MRRWLLLMLLAAVSAAALGAGRSDAQEPDEHGAAVAARVQRFRITEAHVDQWVFGPRMTAATARQLAEARLKARIGSIHQVCGLTPTQRKKLDVAGRGDVKRFFDLVDRMHDEVRRGPIAIDRLGGLTNEAQANGHRLRDRLWGEGSLFGKTLHTILDSEQAARYRRSWTEDGLRAHESNINWVLGMIRRKVELSTAQAHSLHVVLLEETRPPRNSGPWDYFGIMYQASRIPEEKLRPIFEPSEWHTIQREFDEARGMEAKLRASGYLPDDPLDRETVRNGPPHERRDIPGIRTQPDAAGDPPAADETHAT